MIIRGIATNKDLTFQKMPRLINQLSFREKMTKISNSKTGKNRIETRKRMMKLKNFDELL